VFQKYWEINGDFGGSKYLTVVGTLAVVRLNFLPMVDESLTIFCYREVQN